MEKYFILTVETKYGKWGVDNTVLETYEIPYTKEGRQLPLDKAHEVIKKYADCDYEVWAYADFYGYDEATGRKYKKDVFALNNKGFYKNYYFEGYKVYIDDSNDLKQNNMKRIKDNDEYVPQDGDVIVIDYTIDEWQIENYAQSWRCSEEQAVRRWFAEIVERQYDGDISRNYIISHNPPKSIDRTPFTTTEDGNFNIYLSREYEDPYFVAVSKPDRAERLRKLGFFDKCDYEGMYDFEYGNVSDSRRTRSLTRRIKDSVKMKTIRKKITDAKEKFFNNDLKNLQAYRRVTDSEGKIKENVVFLIEDSDVLAVFPNTYGTANRDRDTMVCYSHNGQHGVCTYDYANTLKTADSKQYNELKDELANYVGYNLTIVDSLPSETELKQNAREIRDAFKRYKRGQMITDERLLSRGEEIEYNGKRGKVQYALFHGQKPVVIRWKNEKGSEEFEIPYNEVSELKIHDSDDDIDTNVEPVDNDSDIDDAEVTDNCGGKKKTKKKTADGVKRVKITKRQTKKSE